MKAVNDYIIVEPIKETKKVNGLLYTDKTDIDNRYKKAKVISVGHLAEAVNKNMIVMFDNSAGHEISYNDELYKVIRLRDVVLVDEGIKVSKKARDKRASILR
jgi:co-chaperonin GroES (HSP10)